uniref:Uncharacterized protein n=2 Tax=Opuntia streptacantha TaxID=393608 RepID=A0A7C8ZRE5_OPUST
MYGNHLNIVTQNNEYESQVKGNGNESVVNDLMDNCTDPSAIDGSPIDDPVSQFMHVVPSTESRAADDPPEVFLPGLVIHLIRLRRGIKLPLWKHGGAREEEPPYRAILADRENFKEILISPNMFLDHLPWRCQHALKRVLESRNKSTNCYKNDLFQFWHFLRTSMTNAFPRSTSP